MSFPHFYLADEKFVSAIGGMHPNKEEHETYVDVNPVSTCPSPSPHLHSAEPPLETLSACVDVFTWRKWLTAKRGAFPGPAGPVLWKYSKAALTTQMQPLEASPRDTGAWSDPHGQPCPHTHSCHRGTVTQGAS